MREIKFRGFNGEKWLYGDLTFDTKTKQATISDSRWWRHPVRFDTVGQFTGLLDSNGKEIFEGDILRFAPPLRWEDDERRVGVVVFKYYAFVVKYNDMSTGLFNLAANEAPYTIIGNIYDNPKLLEATHD